MTLYVGSREEQRFLKILDQKIDERLAGLEAQVRQLVADLETLRIRMSTLKVRAS
jgi:hypothetical protein